MDSIRKHSKGFTLIELMVTVAIVAILAAIAYPSYRNQIRKSNRAVAKSTLMTYAQSLERCFTQNATYAGCVTVITNSSTFDSGKNLYAVSITPTVLTTTYTITATAQNGQADDTDCWTFSLTSAGQQTAKTKTNVDNSNNCWR